MEKAHIVYAATSRRRPTKVFCPMLTHGEWHTREKIGYSGKLASSKQNYDVEKKENLRAHPSSYPLEEERWKRT